MTAPLLHGFGVRYDLPAPLALYLYAAGAVVVLSFVLVAAFTARQGGESAVRYPRLEVRWLAAALRSGIPRGVAGAVGVLGLAAVVGTGLFGSQVPTDNPAEYLVWIYFWAGTVIVSGLVGNLYAGLNPWSALYDLITLGRRPQARLRLPDRLGVWPAVAAYFGFAGFELASGHANHPAHLAALALGYSVFTLTGMLACGRDAWLEHVEAFSVLFSVVGRFAPVEIERDGTGRVSRAWLRPWGTGLLQPVRGGWDWIVFVILTLSSLAFDGIEATPAWFNFQNTLAPAGGDAAVAAVKWLGLTLVTVVFVLVFAAIMQLVIAFGRGHDPLATTTAFAFTLVPIALVYNAAHNYSYITVQAQGIFPLLPGVHNYQVSFALAGAATVWYMQVILIVIGHVVAVWLAHLRATERFRTARRVLLSQYPMLLLMVAYTMTSLWILAQPITAGG